MPRMAAVWIVTRSAMVSAAARAMSETARRIWRGGRWRRRRCAAAAVSPVKVGPVREPCYLYAVHDWTRQGTEGFLGHRRGQGQTSGSAARRQEALSLMGDWCGASEPTPRE